ncbi:hypothetical protein F4679DRAFT_600464 [Xylaria curta]|nr:hypothetical protein F4679DRAFT_600464 [Xylaria curta]
MADPQPNIRPHPNPPPEFLKFPLLRATLFLAGVDMKKVVGEFRRDRHYRYLRGVFDALSVKQYPDTSSTKRIIVSSIAEVLAAIGIISLVPIFLRMYYTRSGASPDTGLGLGPAVELPILAAFFTLFALIAAVMTWFSMGEIVRTERLGNFLTFASPPPEICMICHESESVTNLVNLQCYSDAEEADNPGRKPHYFHESCLETWWRNAPPDRVMRCPTCAQVALAYRAVDGEYRYPAPEPSALVWATYSFFSCVQYFFGSRSPMAARGLPSWQDNLGEHYLEVLLRGVGSLCLILVSRLFYAKALYAYYLLLPRWLNEYPATRLCKYLKTAFGFFGMIRSSVIDGLVRQIRSEVGPYINESLIGYIKYVLEWLKVYFLNPDLGPSGDWILHILIVVLSFVFIHGFASRASNFIYDLTLPMRFVPDGRAGRQPFYVERFLQRILALWHGLTRLGFRGGDTNPFIIRFWLILNLFFTVVIGSLGVDGTSLVAYIGNAFEFLRLSPHLAWFFLAVITPSVLCVICFVLYVFYLTVGLVIWKDLCWQLAELSLTHAAAKLCLSFWPAAMTFDLLQDHGAVILTGLFWLPMVINKIRRAWFPLP